MGREASIKEARKVDRAVETIAASHMTGLELLSLLASKGIEVNRQAMDEIYWFGYNTRLKDEETAFYTFTVPGMIIERELTGVVNLITGVLTTMYGRDMEPDKVTQTFTNVASHLTEILHKANLLNRQLQEATGEPYAILVRTEGAIRVYEILAAALASAANKKPVDSIAMFEAVKQIRPLLLGSTIDDIRAANKPGTKSMSEIAYIRQRGRELRENEGITRWKPIAEIMISELEAMPYRPYILENALSTLREYKRQGKHGDYLRDTCRAESPKSVGKHLPTLENAQN